MGINNYSDLIYSHGRSGAELQINMEKIRSNKFGCQIIEKGEELYIRFEEGGVAVKFIEYPISKEEAAEAMQSEANAYKVILSIQNRSK